MMEIKAIREPAVISLAGRISEHFLGNIASRFIRPVLLQINLERADWDMIDALTGKSSQYQEYNLEELYRQIAATAKLVSLVRRELLPNLRNRVDFGGVSGQEKIIRDMAVATFPSNINVLADYLNQLFEMLVKIDQGDTRNGRKPLHARIPELLDVRRNLGFGG